VRLRCASERGKLPQPLARRDRFDAVAAVGPALASIPNDMWLQATITREDLQTYLDELLPLRIALDSGDEGARVFHLQAPRRVELIPSVGVRLETSAHLVWPVLGIDVPATIRSVQVLFEPRIEVSSDNEPALGFRVYVEHLDLSLVPGIVESAIVDVINGELAHPGRLPSWKFTRMLDFRFDVPSALGFAGQMRLFASWADVKINEDGLTLAMSWRAGVEREGTAAAAAFEAPTPNVNQSDAVDESDDTERDSSRPPRGPATARHANT
jgi:hypothetical protein